jgi:hypothetical protein
VSAGPTTRRCLLRIVDRAADLQLGRYMTATTRSHLKAQPSRGSALLVSRRGHSSRSRCAAPSGRRLRRRRGPASVVISHAGSRYERHPVEIGAPQPVARPPPEPEESHCRTHELC